MEENFKTSISEKNGLELIRKDDLKILSIGISTAGAAEIQMAMDNKNRHIVATTIDNNGLEYTKNIVKQKGLENRIELKLEDVSKKMIYSSNYFDFVYARLVLHYLDNEKLKNALSEIYRVMNNNARFFIVVRSLNEWEAKLEGASFDEKTGITKYPYIETIGTDNVEYSYTRLHSKESISEFLKDAGFKVDYIKEYDEYLYRDYERTKINEKPNSIIEVCARKS